MSVSKHKDKLTNLIITATGLFKISQVLLTELVATYEVQALRTADLVCETTTINVTVAEIKKTTSRKFIFFSLGTSE